MRPVPAVSAYISGFLVELEDSPVLPYEGQPVALVIGVHRAADDGIGVVDVLLQVVDFVGHMHVAVQHLREGSAFLELQVLYLVVVIVDVADPEPCALVVNHAGLPVGDWDADVHIFSGHSISS